MIEGFHTYRSSPIHVLVDYSKLVYDLFLPHTNQCIIHLLIFA